MLREGLSFPENNLSDTKTVLEAITHKDIISISHAKYHHRVYQGGNFRAIARDNI